jgi:NAD(P)-dependent dehydrogenase (short-subunit alcohol dehydrogenase family)
VTSGTSDDLAGHVAIVTGGASGIGRETARAMAGAGAAVAVADLDERAANAVVDEIVGDGGVAMPVATDVSDEARVAAMVVTVTEAWDTVSILANVAAVTDRAHQAADGAVADADVSVWERTLSVDLIGSMLTAKHVVPVMVRAGRGAIVNVSSNASLFGDATLSAYAAAKAGLNALTRSIAAAYGKDGIRANTVSPAAIAGPSFTANVPAEVAAVMRDQCLLPELGSPSDVADAIVFLCSDRARFITGQLLSVDGGVSAHVQHLADVRRMGASVITPLGVPGEGDRAL